MTKLFDLVGFVATLILRAVQGAFDVRNAPDSGAQADIARGPRRASSGPGRFAAKSAPTLTYSELVIRRYRP